MKKLYFLLCLFTFAAAFSVHAQVLSSRLICDTYSGYSNSLPHKGEMYSIDSNLYSYPAAVMSYSTSSNWLYDTLLQWYNGTFTYANYHVQGRVVRRYNAAGNMVFFLDQLYDAVNALWENSSMDSFAYSGRNSIIFHLSMTWNKSAGSWQNSQKSNYVYDAANNLLSSITWNWDVSAAGWTNSYKYGAVYSSANDRLADTTFLWDATALSWKGTMNGLQSYTYDTRHNAVTDTFQSWSVSKGAFLYTFRDINVFDAANHLVLDQEDTYDTTTMTWTSASIYRSTYDIAGNWLSDTGIIWDPLAGIYRKSNLFVSTYSTNNDELSRANYYWNNTAGIWMAANMVDWTYDTHHDMLSAINKRWDNATAAYIDSTKSASAFNTYYQPLSSEYYKWDTTTAAWIPTSFMQYYYETYLSVPNVKTPLQAGVKLYPSPATITLNIDIAWGKPQSARIDIYDMNGRLFKQWQSQEDVTYHSNIPIGDMPAGDYILKAKANGEEATARFTVIK